MRKQTVTTARSLNDELAVLLPSNVVRACALWVQHVNSLPSQEKRGRQLDMVAMPSFARGSCCTANLTVVHAWRPDLMKSSSTVLPNMTAVRVPVTLQPKPRSFSTDSEIRTASYALASRRRDAGHV